MKTKIILIATILLCSFVSAYAQKAEPMRIKFAKGKSSVNLNGMLSNSEQMEYVFGAKAGQKITLKVTSQPKGGFFDFDLQGDGFDLETEYDYYTDYTFTAPETGDYFVFVRKTPDGENTNGEIFSDANYQIGFNRETREIYKNIFSIILQLKKLLMIADNCVRFAQIGFNTEAISFVRFG